MISRLKPLIITIILLILNTLQCNCTYFAIEQCPGTDVLNIRHQTQYYELSMIFYYTQWSDESLEALEIYNDVAKLYGDKIYFAAIDCWHLQCNCSKTLTTGVGSGAPHKWPTLVAYYGRRGQLQIPYHGLYVFEDIVQFLEHIMQPLERLEWKEEVEKIKWLSDAVILGVFQNPNTREYKNYMMASLKWLEHDPLRTYRFAVTFTNTMARNLNESQLVITPNLLFMGHKSKKSFRNYHNPKWNASNIIQWLQQELKDDYSLLHGYTTPITIAQKLKKNPVLAIFVNQPQEFFPYMEKYIDFARPFTKANLVCKRKMLGLGYYNSLKIMEIIENLHIFTDASQCHCNLKILLKHLHYYYEMNRYLNDLYVMKANPLKQFHYLDQEINEMLKFFHKTKCLQSDLSLSSPLQIGIVKRLENFLDKETNFLYKNQSISVVLLPTQRYNDYLENLAIPATPQSMATVFVIDKERESIFVMEEKFNIYKLMEFLKKFYTNHLLNYFKNDNKLKSPIKFSTTTTTSSSSITNNDIELLSLNRYIFLNYLHYSHNQTLIVLIYSPECALCGNILHSFLQLASLLRHVSDFKFIRINSLNNDLPWQFNMPFLPSLLVFPKNRFSESRLFPLHLKPDVRHVFAFLLNQLSARDQVKIILSLCQSGNLPTNHSQSCWQFAKTLLMQHIGKHLQYWQTFETERSVIFERLRAFKDMSLDVQRNLRL